VTVAKLDTILLDAETRQTLACLRAYGRAGLDVGVVSCRANASWAPSARSKWARVAAVLPDFDRDAAGFADELLDLTVATSARLVVPGYDGSIEALRSRRADFERVTALGLASEEALDVAVSKPRTMALGAELGILTPRSERVASVGEVGAAIAEVGLPAVVKPEQSWVVRDGVGRRLVSSPVTTQADADRVIGRILSVGGTVLLQQFVPGQREAISIFYAAGRVWAQFAQVSHREYPVLGGVSVLAESVPLRPDTAPASVELVRAMDLEGCSMVEFRRDREGRPVLMEVNPRIGGTVALSLSCGLDFPGLLRNWKLDLPLEPARGYRTGKRLRWLVGDIWNLKTVFESQGDVDVPPRGVAAKEFLRAFRPGAANLDVLDLRDPRPMATEMNQLVLQYALGRLRRGGAGRNPVAMAQTAAAAGSPSPDERTTPAISRA
jgi:predicted ATP-grasp superfamily ATP-dependent carboligase